MSDNSPPNPFVFGYIPPLILVAVISAFISWLYVSAQQAVVVENLGKSVDTIQESMAEIYVVVDGGLVRLGGQIKELDTHTSNSFAGLQDKIHALDVKVNVLSTRVDEFSNRLDGVSKRGADERL